MAAIILTKNEEPRIEECLKHLRPYVDYLLVLDGESTDDTVRIAREYADHVETRPLSGSFAEEKNYARTLVPKDCGWILWCDADERFDNGFLRNIKRNLEFAEENQQVCFRFPRVNLPDGKDWPDFQVRLIRNSRDIEWRGRVHEVPYFKPENIPLDELDKDERERKLGVCTADGCSILHLPRREDERRSWW
ncbi:MAG: glycosyltransferase [Candidatus Bathyarchaeota archaeon]|nr:glycosyltransferase [Candidatus Bathyarchaeota archaeon]